MKDLIIRAYVYCTDFMINLANLLDWSYYEINAVIFCFLYPLLLVGLTFIYFRQKRRLRKLQIQ